MHHDSDDDRVVLQPTDRHEQEFCTFLYELVRPSPDLRAFYTLDVGQYYRLDHALWKSATFDPDASVDEPGARALVIASEGV